jgi:peptidoglycan hydrolase CwlO-like protein
MLRKKHWPILLILALLLSACASSAEEQSVSGSAPSAPSSADDSFGEVEMEEAAEGEAAPSPSTNQQGQVQEQLIIRTGQLDIVVEGTEEALDAIVALANESGGWVVSSSVFQRGEAKAGEVTIRVPVDTFDSAMQQIEEMAIEVQSSGSEGDDVTEEYVDLQARLENLEATADRVRTFLDEADDVEEALAVNAELSRLEGEIESLRGRIQYLEQSAAFSTITVRLTPDELSQPIEVGGWRAEGQVREAIEALISGLQTLATAAIWLVIVFLPIALLVIIPLYLIVRLARRWRRNRRQDTGAVME